jgi:hypothetical protein
MPLGAHAQSGAWTPVVEFKFEDASVNETLTWVSGYAYALTEVGRKTGVIGNGAICLPGNGFVESKVLLEALNSRFKGQRITSEQAAPVLYAAAAQTYKCAK